MTAGKFAKRSHREGKWRASRGAPRAVPPSTLRDGPTIPLSLQGRDGGGGVAAQPALGSPLPASLPILFSVLTASRALAVPDPP